MQSFLEASRHTHLHSPGILHLHTVVCIRSWDCRISFDLLAAPSTFPLSALALSLADEHTMVRILAVLCIHFVSLHLVLAVALAIKCTPNTCPWKHRPERAWEQTTPACNTRSRRCGCFEEYGVKVCNSSELEPAQSGQRDGKQPQPLRVVLAQQLLDSATYPVHDLQEGLYSCSRAMCEVVHATDSSWQGAGPADVYVSTAHHPGFPSYTTLYDRHALVYMDGLLPSLNSIVQQEADMVVGYRNPADILLSFNQYDFPDFRTQPMPFHEKQAGIVSFLAPGHVLNGSLMQELQAALPVHIFITGGNTSDVRSLHPNCAAHKSASAVQECVLAHYQFALVVEREVDKSYITQPMWQALKAGTVPIYVGAPDISKYLPHPHAAILVSELTAPGHLVGYLEQVSSNASLYERHVAWRRNPFTAGFTHTVHTSVSTLVCAVCDQAHTRNHYTGCMEAIVANASFDHVGAAEIGTGWDGMHVYVAHYSKLADRRAHLQQLFERLQIRARVMQGFDKEQLTDAEMGCLYPANTTDGRTWMRHALPKRHAMSRGEMSLFLKHAAIYYDIVARKLPWALVLEDDVLVHSSHTPSSLQAMLDEVVARTPAFDIISLAAVTDRECKPQPTPANNITICSQQNLRGTFAMAVSYSGALKFFKTLPMRWPIDWQLSNIDHPWVHTSGLHMDIYWADTEPPLFGHPGMMDDPGQKPSFVGSSTLQAARQVHT